MKRPSEEAAGRQPCTRELALTSCTLDMDSQTLGLERWLVTPNSWITSHSRESRACAYRSWSLSRVLGALCHRLPGTGLLRVWGHKGCGRRPGRAHRPRLRAGTLVQVHARGSRAPGAQRTQASERASGAGCWVCQPEGQRREAVLALAAVLRGHSAGWGTASCSRAARGRRKPSPEAGTESGTPLTARAGPAAAPLRQARPTFQRALSEARLRHPRDTPATSARPSRGAGLVTHAVGPQAACTGARRSPCLILAVRCRGRVSPHCRPTVGQSGSCPNWVCGPRLFRGKQVLESSLVGET
ncbi:uncharacterized protein LOC113836103 [Cricetulus griseus]|uniref:Uncharacterized protein LOC113836103 n=1 Tax=Cricetulus griseus TaxID=10029 RepID=A0A9J7G665_CRIGR|nr:uncharacterized protein LOC113836103 [Cricetulus griseus]